VDPSRQRQFQNVQSVLIRQPIPNTSLPPLLQMPGEVLDLISDFIMETPTTSPRPLDPELSAKVQTLQNLRYTCRRIYHHSFPRIHFLSFLHRECDVPSTSYTRHSSFQYLLDQLAHPFQYHIHLSDRSRPYRKPIPPYRRIPALPAFTNISRSVLETDWEQVYRSWKEGYGWQNRVRMFERCTHWLEEMQEYTWEGREWGRTANYIVPSDRQENMDLDTDDMDPLAHLEEDDDPTIVGPDIGNGLDQFQWP
jgi:hypothetical protein